MLFKQYFEAHEGSLNREVGDERMIERGCFFVLLHYNSFFTMCGPTGHQRTVLDRRGVRWGERIRTIPIWHSGTANTITIAKSLLNLLSGDWHCVFTTCAYLWLFLVI